MREADDILLNRLNHDPIVFMGCSEKEITILVLLIGVPLFLLGGIFGHIFWQDVFLGVVPAFLLAAVLFVIALRVVRRLKRDKAVGFLQQSLLDQLERFGMIKTPIIRRSGFWSVGTFL